MDREIGHLIKENLQYKLQKKILSKSLHDLQSPLSAVSGYLQLMKICSKGDQDIEKMGRYRQNIESGMDELGEIIEQLRYVESKSSEDHDAGDYEISFSWFLRDLCSNSSLFAKNKNQKVIFEENHKECYIKKHNSITWLFLYNMIVVLLKFIPKESVVVLRYDMKDGKVIVTITTPELVRPAPDVIREIFSDKLHEESVDSENYANGEIQINETMKYLDCKASWVYSGEDDLAIKLFLEKDLMYTVKS